jgi:D-3-phosphoglycerate dehydrogenase
LGDLEKFGKEADAVICQISVEMNQAVIDGLLNCKVISVYGTGYNNVDVPAAARKHIKVCNVPGYCVDDVSDYVIAALYHYNKRIDAYYREIQNGKWGIQAVTEKIIRLSASTLFIVGYGRIGRTVAAKAKALGMNILMYDPYFKMGEGDPGENQVTPVSLAEGLSRADYVTVHVALTKETERLVNREFLSQMKPTACFINASRGKVVDEAALIEAVEKKQIRGAVLDVVETEPPRPDAKILHTGGIVVTPHISYLSDDALNELQETAARNAADVLIRGNSDNIVKAG